MRDSIVVESISDAWARTRSLLLSSFDAGRWLKYGFVAMLGATTVQGFGGMVYSPPAGPSWGSGGDLGDIGSIGPEAIEPLMNALQWIGEHVAALLMLGLGLALVWIVLVFVFLYIRSVFRFIFVECVAADHEPLLGAAWWRHSRPGLSLLLWYVAVGLAPLALLALALVPIVASVALMTTGEVLSIGLGIGGLIAVLGTTMVVMALLALIRALTEDLLVPAMYARRCGVIEGWRHVARAWRGQFWNVVLFYVLKFVMGIGAGIVAGIVSLFSVLLLVLPVLTLAGLGALIAMSGVDPKVAVVSLIGPALVVLVTGGAAYGYILNVLLLPVSVFFQAYALCFVGKMDPALRTL